MDTRPQAHDKILRKPKIARFTADDVSESWQPKRFRNQQRGEEVEARNHLQIWRNRQAATLRLYTKKGP